jgi:hypothetical protein
VKVVTRVHSGFGVYHVCADYLAIASRYWANGRSRGTKFERERELSTSLGTNVRIVPGAPFRYSLLTPKLAVLAMQAVQLYPLTARLTISLHCDDELSALSP